MVPACTASPNVAVTVLSAGTAVAPAAGVRELTVGAAASAAAAVVNVQVSALITLPARSWAPLKVAVYVVDGARLAPGSSVTTRVEALYVTAAGTVVEPFFRTKLIVP